MSTLPKNEAMVRNYVVQIYYQIFTTLMEAAERKVKKGRLPKLHMSLSRVSWIKVTERVSVPENHGDFTTMETEGLTSKVRTLVE